MIDTHCHLNYPPLDTDAQNVLIRAAETGVNAVIIPGTDRDTSFSAVDFSRRFPGVFPAVGIHPHGIDELGEDDILQVRELAELETVVAVGEVGLDYHSFADKTEAEVERQKLAQKALFADMIELAQDVQKPLIIHSRDCFTDIHTQLTHQAGNHPTVIHCFSGSLQEAQQWLELGYLLSFTGMITYKKNSELREIVRQVPLESIMLETDAPYLAPEGFRGQTGEPRFVKNVAECIAAVKGVTLEEVLAITDETALSFFNLPIALS